MELYRQTISELRDLLDRKEVSVKDIVKSIYQRIDAVEEKVKAFVTVTEDKALEMAEEAQKKLDSAETKESKSVLGIPVAIKDNMCTKGIRSTCSSKILYNFIPPYESTVTSRLIEHGYVLIGKTNLDEFAMGSSTENSGFHVTRNPWDLERAPGGSSGGSAAAVASDECIAALGSDTGGSIRQPASLCGVVGLKPTYGRVSRYGLVAFASSLDQIGPITKNVRDAAILMNIISGRDPFDSTSAPLPVPDFTAVIDRDIKGMKIGI
ncbi:MAG: amidase family protein, partial [Nitrospirota bacterium]|nr:amidase family protein [Nitrospirota bacterium]